MRTSLRTIPPPDTYNRQATSVISLDQVRSGLRTTNEYVDSPRARPLPPLKNQLASIAGGNSPGFARRVNVHSRVGWDGNSSIQRPVLTSSSVVISQQPQPKSPPLKKEAVTPLEGTDDADRAHVGTSHGDGIICERCGKCRCSACTEPRPLPSYWCCHNSCEVSPDKALDVCSCFCCIKCIFYHCGSEEDNDCYEKPCGCCSTPHCCKRWTVMGALALCLPCLWAYLPAKACLTGCSICLNHCRHKGCQCHAEDKKTSALSSEGSGKSECGSGDGGIIIGGNPKHSQTRRLLIESDSSST